MSAVECSGQEGPGFFQMLRIPGVEVGQKEAEIRSDMGTQVQRTVEQQSSFGSLAAFCAEPSQQADHDGIGREFEGVALRQVHRLLRHCFRVAARKGHREQMTRCRLTPQVVLLADFFEGTLQDINCGRVVSLHEQGLSAREQVIAGLSAKRFGLIQRRQSALRIAVEESPVRFPKLGQRVFRMCLFGCLNGLGGLVHPAGFKREFGSQDRRRGCAPVDLLDLVQQLIRFIRRVHAIVRAGQTNQNVRILRGQLSNGGEHPLRVGPSLLLFEYGGREIEDRPCERLSLLLVPCVGQRHRGRPLEMSCRVGPAVLRYGNLSQRKRHLGVLRLPRAQFLELVLGFRHFAIGQQEPDQNEVGGRK